jgi:hypothetical protein
VKNEGPLVRGDWANLENFMKEEYGKELPTLRAQIDVSSLQSVLSSDQDLLSANSEQTEVGVWGGCSSFGPY